MFRRNLDEVIEDSEPEREARRQQRRLERKRRVDPPIVDVVIDLSEEEEEAFSRHSAPPAPSSSPSIIDISDDSLTVSSPNKSTTSHTPPPFESEDSEIEIHALPLQSKPLYNIDDSAIFEDSLSLPSLLLPTSSRKSMHGGPQTEELAGSEHDDDDDGLNLSRFAFKAPQPIRARKEPTTIPQTSRPAPSRAKKQNERFGDIPDAQLNKLLKCVCCNLAWTARKSAAQKLVHLRSCAKKLAFSDETVRVRMTQYLATVVEPVAKTNEISKDTSGTYFQDIVQEAAPKKRTRRKEAAGTVKAPEDARNSILRRAQTLLVSSSEQFAIPAMHASAPSILGHPSSSRDVSESEAEDSHAVPLTQPFRASKFARPMSAESVDEDELPPATQAFAPSKFGAQSDLLSRSPSPSSPILSRPSFLNDSPPASTTVFLPSSSNVHLPMSPSTSHLMSSPDFRSPKEAKTSSLDMTVAVEDNIYDANDDDAFLHFEPGEDVPTPLVLTVPDTPAKPGRKKQSKAKVKVKDVTKTVASRWKEEEFDDRWEQQMKGKIKADEDLYFRILRYEPIHFDVFLKLATVADRPVSGMLKYQVRGFLDKQAITFYGGDQSWRR